MTPLEIHILLDIHALARFEDSHYASSPLRKEILDQFYRDGLIVRTADPILTDRGRAHVLFLESMPLPVAHWAIPGPWDPKLPPSTFKAWEGEQ
jgi:hypothetical protein